MPEIYSTPETMRRRKIVKRGFKLCLMVCGQSGTGKSTFVATLCGNKVLSAQPEDVVQMTIRSTTVPLGDSDATIKLTVVETPGFGDSINNDKCCSEILAYLEKAFDEVLEEEARVERTPRFVDNRVHVALYFIEPTGHGLRELDIDFMKTLSTRVNVIPVIAKADTLTPDEVIVNKRAIMRDIAHFQIPIFYFPYGAEENDDETKQECDTLRELVPFALVGSDDMQVYPDGSCSRGREYPWGFVEVDNPDHSDFVTLRSVLFGSHLTELRELTHDVLYERYRTDKLLSRATGVDDAGFEVPFPVELRSA